MVDKIKLENSSPLCSLQHTKNEKLVLAGRDFTWMTPEEIKAKKGKDLTDSLADIAKQLKNAEISVDDEEALENLLINLTLLDREIQHHNKSIENNGFLHFIDIALNYVTGGTTRLKYHSVSEQIHSNEKACKESLSEHPEYRGSILKKYSETPDLLSDLPELSQAIVESLVAQPHLTHEEISHLLKIYPHLPKETRTSLLPYFDDIDTLLEASNPVANEYVNKRSEYLDTIGFSADASPEQVEKIYKLLSRLIPLGNRNIQDEVRANPPLRKKILNYHKDIPIEQRRTFPTQVNNFFIEINGLEIHLAELERKDKLEIERRKQEAEKQKAEVLFREIVSKQDTEELKNFFTSNVITSGLVGSPSKKDSQILKFKASQYKIPHDISYNRTTGDILVNYGQVGKGAFKVVKKKMALLSTQLLAVGKQKLSAANAIERRFAKKEIEYMEKLKGKPNVLQLHHANVYHSKKKGEVMLTMTEFCNMGELKGHMESLSEKQKLQVAKGMIRGVLEAHKAGIIHRDLKPQNFFLKQVINDNGEEEFVPVLGDFGLACWAKGDPDINLRAGSPLYLAPGIMNGTTKASFASDAWSMGVIFTQLFGNSDFDRVTTMPGLEQLWRQLGLKPAPSNKESKEYVIWKLLRPNVSDRMSLEEALAILEKLST